MTGLGMIAMYLILSMMMFVAIIVILAAVRCLAWRDVPEHFVYSLLWPVSIPWLLGVMHGERVAHDAIMAERARTLWTSKGFYEDREPTPAERAALFNGYYNEHDFDDRGYPWMPAMPPEEALDYEIHRRIEALPRDLAAEKRIDASTFDLAQKIE